MIIRTDWAPTPWRDEAGRRIALELVCHRPHGAGPFPTLVFHHGSTGNGTDAARRTLTWVAQELGEWLVLRGWQVFFAQRRGRGRSGGVYDEGLAADGSGYARDVGLAAAGVQRALADLDAATARILAHGDVDRQRVLVGGVSRGGVLALLHAALHPFTFRAALNFAGGWLGHAWDEAALVNPTLFVRSAAFPGDTLWIYADGDGYYPAAHIEHNFRCFQAAGGRGRLHILPAPPHGPAHHIHRHPPAWEALVGSYLAPFAPQEVPCR